ncbi:prepilin-type cleavage/methylation domain-containing protein [Pseudomonas veronii]|uniref:type 4 pilus major pilin n=1 Tax=Pseudomonas veronii TaxID=76761 RepID=UPI0015A1C805|nr:type 4 pilus major pilin [Pseudomonas veronii]NWD56719.1 prepilin-type cleavage/methylation domain-containing protein [Pseudomonas veronii]
MKYLANKKKQEGNYLLSIGIGIMILGILAVWGIPKIQDYIVEGAIPSVAEESQRFIARVQVSNSGSGTTPYTGLTQAYFARSVRGTSLQVGTIAGEGTGGTVVRHGLGGGNNGTVVISTTGDSFALTFNSVNAAACPGLATALQRTVDDISINGKTVKITDTDKTVSAGYVAGAAATQCGDGDTNTFVFTIR